jgi:hypothetical protein
VKFSSARAAVIWAWGRQFECLIGSNPLDPDRIGVTNSSGNISAGLAAAMDIKRWLERAAYRVGLESLTLILLSELPQEQPIELLPWQQRRVDAAMDILEAKLDRVGWLEEKGIVPYHEAT